MMADRKTFGNNGCFSNRNSIHENNLATMIRQNPQVADIFGTSRKRHRNSICLFFIQIQPKRRKINDTFLITGDIKQ